MAVSAPPAGPPFPLRHRRPETSRGRSQDAPRTFSRSSRPSANVERLQTSNVCERRTSANVERLRTSNVCKRRTSANVERLRTSNVRERRTSANVECLRTSNICERRTSANIERLRTSNVCERRTSANVAHLRRSCRPRRVVCRHPRGLKRPLWVGTLGASVDSSSVLPPDP